MRLPTTTQSVDAAVGEILRNLNDADGVVRELLPELAASPTVSDFTVREAVTRVMAAWELAVEITADEYLAAEGAAATCSDSDHLARFPGRGGLPAHTAVHLGA